MLPISLEEASTPSENSSHVKPDKHAVRGMMGNMDMLAQKKWPIGGEGEAVDKLDCKIRNNHGEEEPMRNPSIPPKESSLRRVFIIATFL